MRKARFLDALKAERRAMAQGRALYEASIAREVSRAAETARSLRQAMHCSYGVVLAAQLCARTGDTQKAIDMLESAVTVMKDSLDRHPYTAWKPL